MEGAASFAGGSVTGVAPPKDLSFGEALALLHEGKKLARRNWNGKDMFVFLVEGSEFEVNRAPLNKIYDEGTKVTYRPHMDLKAVDGTIGIWTVSQNDIFNNDWFVVD